MSTIVCCAHACCYLHRHNILTSPRHFGGATGKDLDDDDLSDDGEELVFGNSDDER